MDIIGLTNNINMWIPIDNFLSYKELSIEAKKYYNNTVKYCFASKNNDLYIISFELKDDNSFDLKYGYFSDLLKNIFTSHIEFSYFFPNIRKYGFNKKIKDVFKCYKNHETELLYYTHVYNIYKLIQNSILL
jgi:hypothetical protein